MRRHLLLSPLVLALAPTACVPAGNSTPSDAGSKTQATPAAATFHPSAHVMTAPFEDNFERTGIKGLAPHSHFPPLGDADTSKDGAVAQPTSDSGEAAAPDLLGSEWSQAGTDAWHIENGWLCGAGAHNHGVWLNRVLPVNARIEFDAKSDAQDGDLKAELWGDGHSAATAISYTNATSYLTILGGWHNKFHVLARINEHGDDRKEIKVDPESDDPREKPVVRGQIYHFKVERSDGKTVKWSVNGVEMLQYDDRAPLIGQGHDHFGFNDWEAKVCFDNVRVTPISSL